MILEKRKKKACSSITEQKESYYKIVNSLK